MIHEITNKEQFTKLVLRSDLPVLVDYWGSWCRPCLAMSSVIRQVAEDVGDKAKVCKVCLDEDASLAEDYNISSIPTLIFLD